MEIIHDRAGTRFHASVPGGVAVLRYHLREPRIMDILSTYVPPAARGQGVAGALVQTALRHAESEGYSVVPSCWYVRTWVDRNPAYAGLLVD
jgi:predicted GNAT family acetyltransferase